MIDLDRNATYLIDGQPYRYVGTFWGRIHLIGRLTGTILRIAGPGGRTIEPDAYDFADMCGAGRVDVRPGPPPFPPRRPRSLRPWPAAPASSRASLPGSHAA